MTGYLEKVPYPRSLYSVNSRPFAVPLFCVFCAFLRLILIVSAHPGVFAALRKFFFASHASFVNSFSNPFPLETMRFLP
jgi:hypothetical protein